MRHVRAIPPAVLALLATGVLHAHAADAPLSGEQIRELARKETVWCENYRPASRDCETITLVSLLPDGSLRETGVMQLANDPELRMVIDGRSRIEGDRVCSVFGDDSVKFSFLLDGAPAPGEAVDAVEAAVRESMSEFEGKTLCQAFTRGPGEKEMREIVTVDGVRREDLESIYRIQDDEAGLNIRPAQDDAAETIA